MKLIVNVSIIMPCYNEVQHIAKCMESIVANDFPKNKLEVLIYDGGSTDSTLNILKEYTQKYSFIHVKSNNRKIQAAAMNLGIKEAQGDIVIRMDAHTVYEKDYISQAVKLLNETSAVNVGGPQAGQGNSYFTNSLVMALSNAFISGNAVYRSDKNVQQYVDTVYLGAWHKKDLEAIGGFDESFMVNEDYELNYRLRKKSGQILFSPKIKSTYYARSSLFKLIKQYFRYGFWKAKTLKKHPASLKIRQMAAPLFILTLFFSIAFTFCQNYYLLWLLSGCYVIVFVLLSRSSLNMKNIKYVPAVFFIALFIHLSWGVGFFAGLIRWCFYK
ncbi:MAG: glycosyltransferase family 2 protein [Candidatus Omnitrophica bacterium]|nr:glycosyltransferase family 2 protein [Candidatus Omnitrophota bacterium]